MINHGRETEAHSAPVVSGLLVTKPECHHVEPEPGQPKPAGMLVKAVAPETAPASPARSLLTGMRFAVPAPSGFWERSRRINRNASFGRFGIADAWPPSVIAVPTREGVDPRFLQVYGGPRQAGSPELVQGNARCMATGNEDA